MKCSKCNTELKWGDISGVECWYCPDCFYYDDWLERYEPEWF